MAFRTFKSEELFVDVENPFDLKSPGDVIVSSWDEGCDGVRHAAFVASLFKDRETGEVVGFVDGCVSHIQLGTCDGSCVEGLNRPEFEKSGFLSLEEIEALRAQT